MPPADLLQVETKTCPGCNQQLPSSAYARNRTARDGLQYRCRACHAQQIASSKARRTTRLTCPACGEDRAVDHLTAGAYCQACAWQTTLAARITRQRRAADALRGRLLLELLAHWASSRPALLPAPPQPVAPAPRQYQPRFTSSRCDCGTWTTSDLALGGATRWCSMRCRKRQAERRRRALLRGAWDEDVVAVLVFERDGWTCHLCDQPCDRVFWDGSNPRAATLDHVVPLAREGRHSYANVRTAHALCNALKGDRDGVQVRVA